MNSVIIAIDRYQEAVCLASEATSEERAKAYHRLGRVHETVLKADGPAQKYYHNAVQIGLVCQEKVPTVAHTTWFKESAVAVERYKRVAQRVHEEAQRAKERAEVHEDLKEELKVIQAKSKFCSAEAFLGFLYEKHSPKRGEMVELGTSELLKKALRTALLHYHPDKNGRWGLKWQILCQEITKGLNSKYSSLV